MKFYLTMYPVLRRPNSGFKRCVASRRLTGSKLAVIVISAAQLQILCQTLVHTASGEVPERDVRLNVLLFKDNAHGFRRLTFLGLNFLVTVGQ